MEWPTLCFIVVTVPQIVVGLDQENVGSPGVGLQRFHCI